VTTSASYAFDPTAASTLDEISERAGIDPATLTHRHITSIMQSINYAIRELEMADLSSFARQDNESTTVSTATLSPASGTIDILRMTVVENSVDIPISRMSRDDYFNMANKTQTGTPSMYWVNYESLSPVVTFWPVPDTTYTVKYDRLRYTQSVTALSETLDLQKYWIDAMVYGAAMRTAEKYSVERVPLLKGRFLEMCEKAKQTKIGRGPIIMSVRSFGTSRTRRR
jgi:hypothetical protein